MIYSFFYSIFTICYFSLEALWIFRDIATIGIPWGAILFIILWCLSKIFRLPSPSTAIVDTILGPNSTNNGTTSKIIWSVARSAAGLDAPANTLTAIKQCLSRGCSIIHLDVNITTDETLVLGQDSIYLSQRISNYNLENLKNVNVSNNHPLSNKFPNEKIATLTEALKLLISGDKLPTIMLNVGRGQPKFINAVLKELDLYDNIKQKTVFVLTSPYAIYQLRRSNLSLVCALWMNYPSVTWGFLGPLYSWFMHSIVAPLIGISAVIIHKDVLSVSEVNCWQHIGVRPYGYPVNTPSAKRYFQTVLSVPYLTDSLRTEPPMKTNHAILK